MSDPNVSDPSINVATDDHRSQSFKQNLSKFEYDLYHEEDDKTEKVIRVKRTGSINKGERWKIFADAKLILTIDGDKISKKEKEFLRTVQGVSFVIRQAKVGIKSFNKLKIEMKKVIEQATIKSK